ncbi:MAG: hypothetical protein COA44_13080 [Arcobacter sp.]|nr:MAG: hypothetical protein COA44_13080 [Arcobacter sp.]
MQGLKTVTFFNTDRFPYSHININGNTMFVGTNGSGKTTTMRTLLTFYGSDKLGLNNRQTEEKAWSAYAYPHDNSYICYYYEGAQNNILLITYRTGNRINYRFSLLDVEDIETFLKGCFIDNDEFREPKDVFSLFKEKGIELSNRVSGLEKYTKILYGDTKGDLREFAKYTLLKCGRDYEQIPTVLSSIFLNSSLKSRDIDKVLAGSIDSYAQIDLEVLGDSINRVIDLKNTIVNFEKTEKEQLKVLSSYTKYHDLEKKASYHLKQLFAHYDRAKRELPILTEKLPGLLSSQEAKLKINESSRNTSIENLEKAHSSKVESKIKQDEAIVLKQQYSDGLILKKQVQVDKLPFYRDELSDDIELLNNLVGSKQDVSFGFDKRVLGLEKQCSDELNAEDSKTKASKFVHTEKIKELHASLKKEILSINTDSSTEKEVLVLLNKSLTKEVNELNVELRLLNSRNPFDDELREQTESVKTLAQELVNLKQEKDTLQDGVRANSIETEKLDKSIIRLGEDATTNLDIRLSPFLQQISEQKDLLNVDEETFLGFLRKNQHPKEDLLASLLKEKEILLNKELDPKIINSDYSLFGLEINEENLAHSNYSQESITLKIQNLDDAKEGVRKEVEDKLQEDINSLKNEIKTISAKSLKANERLGTVTQQILNETVRLERLKDDLREKLLLSTAKWDTAKKEAKEAFTTKTEEGSLASEKLSSFYDVLEEKRETSRTSTEKLVGVINTKIEEDEQESLNIKDKLSSKLKKDVNHINDEKEKALKEEGIDTVPFKSIETKIDSLKKQILKIEKDIPAVSRYVEDRIIIENIPVLNKILKGATTAHSNAVTSNDILIDRLDKEEATLTQRIKDVEEGIAKYRTEINDCDDKFLIRRERKEYGIANQISTTQCEKHLYLHGIELGAIEKDMNYPIEDIRIGMSNIISNINAEKEQFGLTMKASNTLDILGMAKDLKVFRDSNMLVSLKSLAATIFRDQCSSLNSAFGDIIKESDKVRVLINKIRANLSLAINDVAVLDKLDIKYSPYKSEILSLFESLNEIDLPIGDKNSLFWDGNSEAHIKAYDYLVEISDLLRLSNSKKITVLDTFETEFLYSQNGRVSQWVKARNSMGSNGTTIIVKTLIYVSLLDAVLKKASKDRNILVHVLLDEIGTLSQANMNAIISFANSMGINFTTAAPTSKTHRLYERTYYYQVNEKNKTSRSIVIEKKKPVRKTLEQIES